MFVYVLLLDKKFLLEMITLDSLIMYSLKEVLTSLVKTSMTH